MTIILIAAISITVSASIILILSRDVFRMMMGLALMGTSANLIVFLGGRPGSLLPAVIDSGQRILSADAANPLPQALVLTAIVIGFALFCFALVLTAVVMQQQGHADLAKYRNSEPGVNRGEKTLKPPVMEID